MRILPLLLTLLTGCGSSASCAVCAVSFSDAECDEIALANGCESGVAVQDTGCQPPTQGCEFAGCPTGEEIRCDLGADTDS